MKKIMIVAAIVCAAAFANAASVNWTGSAIAQDPDKAGLSTYGVYLVDASKVAQATMVAALTEGDFSKLAGDNIVKTTASIAVGSTAARWSATGWGDYAAGTEVSWYTVVLNDAIGDATYFMATDAKNFKAPTAGPISAGFGSQASNTWVAVAPSPTPEPTSGLLLVLGIAGLALKRKRA